MAEAIPQLQTDMLTTLQAAQALGIHYQSLVRLRKQKRIHGHKVFGVYVYDRAYIKQWQWSYNPRSGRKTWPGAVTT